MPSESASSTIPPQVPASLAEAELSQQTAEYRKQLAQLEAHAQDSYDKAVITLSGGALGVSFAFLKDIAGPAGHRFLWLALIAWICWTISLGCVLWSFYSSRAALRCTIRQIDQGADFSKGVGGSAEKVTQVLNLISGVGFVVGALLFVAFSFLSGGRPS